MAVNHFKHLLILTGAALFSFEANPVTT